jgi:phage shock protein PspC (stress-responsive transcriptional regulator)
MNLADEIKHLHELHQKGALSDAEFAQAKAKLLASDGGGQSSFDQSFSNSGIDPALQQFNHFRRSKNDRWFGGICGGLGKTTTLDSSVWRLLFVIFTIYFGAGLLAYFLAWIIIPQED